MVFFYNYFFKKTNNYFTINNLNQIDVIRLHNEHNRLFNAFNIAHKEILKNDYKD